MNTKSANPSLDSWYNAVLQAGKAKPLDASAGKNLAKPKQTKVTIVVQTLVPRDTLDSILGTIFD